MYCGQDFPFVQPGERPVLAMDFSSEVSADEMVSSFTVTCEDENGVDTAAADRLAGLPELDGLVVMQGTVGLVAGARYRVTFTLATTNQTDVLYSYLDVFPPGT